MIYVNALLLGLISGFLSATSSDNEPYCKLYDVTSGSDTDMDSDNEPVLYQNDYYIPTQHGSAPILVCGPVKCGPSCTTIQWDDLIHKGEVLINARSVVMDE